MDRQCLPDRFGRRAVVVYAPRHFTNRQQTFDRGGFVAVVDLTDGAVRKLAIRTSLAYYNPGCGVDEVAVLTQSGVVDLGRTRLHVLDTVHASVVRRHELPGQVTSAVPAGTGVVAAAAGGLVEVTADGGRRQVAKTRGTPFDIHPDRLGGVAFLERHGDAGVVRYLPSLRSTARELARGPLTEVGLAAGRDGQVFITGAPTGVGKDLPGSVRRVPAAVTAEVSTLGVAAVSHGDPAKATPPARPMEPVLARPVPLTARVLSSGRELTFEVLPGSRRADGHEQDRSAGPRRGRPIRAQRQGPGAAGGSPTDPCGRQPHLRRAAQRCAYPGGAAALAAGGVGGGPGGAGRVDVPAPGQLEAVRVARVVAARACSLCPRWPGTRTRGCRRRCCSGS